MPLSREKVAGSRTWQDDFKGMDNKVGTPKTTKHGPAEDRCLAFRQVMTLN